MKWTHYVMLNAEEAGITSANVEQMKTSDNPDIKRILGTEGTFGEPMGLTNDWAANVIAKVGNYGEVFDRNIGPEDAARHRARPERAVDQGRPAVRPAGPLIS